MPTAGSILLCDLCKDYTQRLTLHRGTIYQRCLRLERLTGLTSAAMSACSSTLPALLKRRSLPANFRAFNSTTCNSACACTAAHAPADKTKAVVGLQCASSSVSRDVNKVRRSDVRPTAATAAATAVPACSDGACASRGHVELALAVDVGASQQVHVLWQGGQRQEVEVRVGIAHVRARRRRRCRRRRHICCPKAD
jgi:hypothetical protein